MALSRTEAADQLELAGILHLPFGYLSAGQQRRMAMAKLLVAYRPLWLLDEPTAALDAGSEAIFAAMVNRHLEAGGMAIAATHQALDLNNPKSLVMAGFVHQAHAGDD